LKGLRAQALHQLCNEFKFCEKPIITSHKAFLTNGIKGIFLPSIIKVTSFELSFYSVCFIKSSKTY
ncbi:MAG: hypothetical protein K8S23_08110, partial [Candidatus Cloacimonetes bacterium]|nr:hypothetical protein [Candidatus Cloacimonadota bacterium]